MTYGMSWQAGSSLLLVCLAILVFLCVLKAWPQRKKGPVENVLVVLGSGGHTAEMLALVQKLDKKRVWHWSYVVAATDRLSASKAEAHESSLCGPQMPGNMSPKAKVFRIPRSREVGQSYITSVWTTIVAIVAAFRVVLQVKPDVVLVNGPGTCIPICAVAAIFRRFHKWHGQIVYIESIARVATLSLSGKILYHCKLADLFLVQWPNLQARFPQARCCGRLY